MTWGLISMGIFICISIITYLLYRNHIRKHEKAKKEIADLFADLSNNLNPKKIKSLKW